MDVNQDYCNIESIATFENQTYIYIYIFKDSIFINRNKSNIKFRAKLWEIKKNPMRGYTSRKFYKLLKDTEKKLYMESNYDE